MLRDYQLAAVADIRARLVAGTKKVLLHLATGSGKTVIFSYILKELKKDKRAIMVVRGRNLVQQAHERLINESVPHGVLMSGHPHYKPDERIQICSIDTIHKRGHYPPADLVVIDEVHMASSGAYKKLAEVYSQASFLGVTATPYQKHSIAHVVEAIVRPITMRELIEKGYLVRSRAFRPRAINVHGVKTSCGDYIQDQLSDFMDKPQLIGDIVEEWQKLGEGRPTLCFAVSVQHSKNIVESFRLKGIAAEHLDANSPDLARQKAFEDLRYGKIKIISSVGVLTTGVDLPFVSCLILARPTKSYLLYVQMVGRATRPYEGKQNFLILDHADCVQKHGFVIDEPDACIDGKFSAPTSNVKICKRCFRAHRGKTCPECGPEETLVKTKTQPEAIETIPGELVEMHAEENVNWKLNEARLKTSELIQYQKQMGYLPGWVFHRVMALYGEEIARAVVPYRRH